MRAMTLFGLGSEQSPKHASWATLILSIAGLILPATAFVAACTPPELAQVSQPTAESSLRPHESQTSEGTISLVPTLGHSGRVTAIGFSDDLSRALTASEDWTALEWDIRTGKVVTRFLGHRGPIQSAAYSPDERIIATAGDDGTLRLWDAETGSELRQLTIRPSKLMAIEPEVRSRGVNFHDIAFGPDGRSIVAGTSRGVWVIDVESGEQTELVPSFGRIWTDIPTVAFSEDGRWILCGYWAGILIWDADTKEIYRELKRASFLMQSITEEKENVSAAAFASGGRLVAAGSTDGVLRIWSVDRSEILWERTAHESDVTSVAFSQDGGTLLSSSTDGTVSLWSVAEGKQLSAAKPRFNAIYAAIFGPRDQVIGIANYSAAQILGTFNLMPIQYLLPEVQIWSSAIAASPDGRYLAVGDVSANVSILDLRQGVITKKYNKVFGTWVESLAFSPDSMVLMAGSGKGEVASWRMDTEEGALTSVDTGEVVRTGRFGGHPIKSVAYSPPQGRYVAISTDNSIKVWDTYNEAPPKVLKGWWLTARDSIYGATFSRDGRYLLGHFLDEGGIRVWDLETWDVHQEIVGGPVPMHSGAIKSAAMSSDNQLILSGGDDKTMRLWSMQTGKFLGRFDHSSEVSFVSFLEDGRSAVSVAGRRVFIWNLKTGDLQSTLQGHEGPVVSTVLLPDGRHLVTAGQDGTIRFWNLFDQVELAAFSYLYGGEWITFAPNGLFDAPIGGLDHFQWRITSADGTQDVLPVESFQREFYRDGLLPDLLSGKRPQPPANIGAIDRRLPKVELHLPEVSELSNVKQRRTTVEVRVTSAPPDTRWTDHSGARDVRLFRNGILVKIWKGEVLGGRDSRTLSTSVSLVAGRNVLTAYAFNRHDVKSRDQELWLDVSTERREEPRVHVLTVGINDYGFPEENLTMSVADAEAFAQAMVQRASATPRLSPGNIVALTDSSATELRVLATLEAWVGSGPPSITTRAASIQPEDTLFLFFSGHGVATEDQFYLLMSDTTVPPSALRYANDSDPRLRPALSTSDLERALEDVDAGRIVLVIDACYSGKALHSDDPRRGQLNTRGLAQFSFEKGISVLTAAQSYQTARAASALGHGYLTHALISDGIREARADRSPTDRYVTIPELFEYAEERVPQLVRHIDEQRRQIGLQRQRLLSGNSSANTVEGPVGEEADYQIPRAYIPRHFYVNPIPLFQLEEPVH